MNVDNNQIILNANEKVSFSTLIKLIDFKPMHFVHSFLSIKRINSNAKAKTPIEHFTSVGFGKLAECLVFKYLKQELQLSNENFMFYPMNEKGYEIADLVINLNNIKQTIEVRSSFQPSLNKEHHQIIRYLNNFKKVEHYKDLYFQVMIFSTIPKIRNEITPLFHCFQFYLDNNFHSQNIRFKKFLDLDTENIPSDIQNQIQHIKNNLDQEICTIEIISFLDIDFIQENKNFIKTTNLSPLSNTKFEAIKIKDCLSF